MTVSVRVQSDSPVENSTMQIKPQSKIVPVGDTPEWKKRLLLGEALVGEGGDLFGPMELENVFKPPPPTAKPTTQTNILTSIQAKQPASVPLISSREGIPDNSPNGIDGTQKGKPAGGDQDNMERYNTSMDKAKCSFGYIQGSGSLGFDPRSRTLSGREELRNEEITPILFSKDETAREHTNRTFLESILDRGKSSVVTGKEGLYSRRRDSVVSDDYSYLSHRGEQTFSNGTEQTVEMTSQSLPEDLSVGTTDFVSTGGFIRMRRGDYSNEGSFRHHQLTPTSLLSTLHSSSFLSSSKLRNSPHVDRRKGIFTPQQQQEQQHQNQQSPSKFLTPYRERRETNDSRPRSSGSPLEAVRGVRYIYQ
ncbi:conserved leucine-rich repeat protein [Paracoccidioides lutzii Pb01]|uniref:Conserved leucine-rich repeat protein n=1 Tax=Paracoccidioides lutzii (strain ATCC MYA-826 / Pb01) TaxID=502779 RepID=C1H338_PARBA|nr:conserved leucine-rich repeat protein [Paracoccidioides lutzii Pb01]EEH34132.2 conserved leucine-rich repeat protein [Paracoccidioides lutzii Pb01]